MSTCKARQDFHCYHRLDGKCTSPDGALCSFFRGSEGPDSPRSGCPVQAVVPDSLREAGQLRGTGGEAPHSSLAERGWNN